MLFTMRPNVEVIGDISDIETIAVGDRIRDLRRLTRTYGNGRWRKLKGKAKVRLPDGTISQANVHWYEMASVGRKDIKVKGLIL